MVKNTTFMIVLKIICFIVTVITCVVNVIYLIKSTKTFSDRFYKKYENYDDKKLEKYRNGLYNRTDKQIEMLKKGEVFILILLKQSLIAWLLSVCGTVMFFLGVHSFAKTQTYLAVYLWSLLVIFLILTIILLFVYTKKAKKVDLRYVYKYSPELGSVDVPDSLVSLVSLAVSLNFAAVIGIIPIIFGQ